MEESKKEEHEKRAEIRAQRVSETAQILYWREDLIFLQVK